MLEIGENTNDTFQQIAQNLVYTDRRMSNQELAYRLAQITAEDMEKVADE
jgi:predicted Zn-dependent peptidase